MVAAWSQLPTTVWSNLVNSHADVPAILKTVCRSWRDAVNISKANRLVYPDFELPPNSGTIHTIWCYLYKRNPHRDSVSAETIQTILHKVRNKSDITDVRLLVMTLQENVECKNSVCPSLCMMLQPFSSLTHLSLRTMAWQEARGLPEYSAVRFLPPTLISLDIDIRLEHTTKKYNSLKWFNSLTFLKTLRIFIFHAPIDEWGVDADGVFDEDEDTPGWDWWKAEFLIGDLVLPCLNLLHLHSDGDNTADIVATHLTFQHIPCDCSITCDTIGLLSAPHTFRSSPSDIDVECIKRNVKPPGEFRN